MKGTGFGVSPVLAPPHPLVSLSDDEKEGRLLSPMNSITPEAGWGARPSLLLADDDPVVRSALGAQLAGEFEVVAVAKDAAEAVELALEHQPAAALLDVQMPKGGALEAVPGIVAGSPNTCVVILSADESREMVLELLGAGAIAYVRKGVPASEIAKTLGEALKVKAGHPQA